MQRVAIATGVGRASPDLCAGKLAPLRAPIASGPIPQLTRPRKSEDFSHSACIDYIRMPMLDLSRLPYLVKTCWIISAIRAQKHPSNWTTINLPMPASQRPPYWEQAESKASPNDIQEYLSVYSECTTVYTAPSTSSKSSRMKLYNTKSAIWSFMKGKPSCVLIIHRKKIFADSIGRWYIQASSSNLHTR